MAEHSPYGYSGTKHDSRFNHLQEVTQVLKQQSIQITITMLAEFHFWYDGLFFLWNEM